jgi:hypothetical protein
MPHRLYISFAPEDTRFRDALRKHLAPLLHSRNLDILDAASVPAGVDWAQACHAAIESADAAVLLLSPDFVANEATWLHDLPAILARHQRDRVPMIPVVVRPVTLSDTPLAGRKSLPADGRPVGSPGNDQAWTEIVTALRSTLDSRPIVAKEPLAKGFPPALAAAAPSVSPPVPPAAPAHHPAPGPAPAPPVPAAPPAPTAAPPPASPATVPAIPDSFKLTGDRMKKLADAVLSAFPRYQSLSRAVRYGLNERLEALTSAQLSLADVIFDLLTWAESHGKEAALLRALLDQNPGNEALRRFAEEISIAPSG